MTSKQFRKLAVLRKRRDHLAERVNTSAFERTYDKAEIGALDWALDIIENADMAGVLDDFDSTRQQHDARMRARRTAC